VPYLIAYLGIGVYGLVPLAISLVDYMGIVPISFNLAVVRYLTIDLQKRDTKSANKTFNTAFWTSVGLVFLILPGATLFSYFVPNIFNVPSGQEYNTRLFFFLILGAFLIPIISNNFNISSFAYNRFDLRNSVLGLGRITRVVLIIFLFTIFSAQLWHVGLSYLGGELIVFSGAVWLWRKLTPELKIRWSSFDRARFHNLISMGGWTLVNQMGTILLFSTELVVVNKLCGVESGGQYATVFQWVILLRSLADVVVYVLTPIIFTYYANSQIEQIIDFSKKAVKFLGLTMALPIGLICGFASPLLSIWIGSEFSILAPLMWLLVGHLCIDLAVLPFFPIQQSFNKVRIPGIVTLIMGIVNILLATFFALALNWGMYGVAAAEVVILTFRHAIFTPCYGARILNKAWYTFLAPMVPGVISAGTIAIISLWISHHFTLINWISLIIHFGIISLIYGLVVFFIILKHDEREMILSLLPTRM